MVLLIEPQIKLTCWAIFSLTGGGLGKVEEGERQGEKEKNHLSHPQEPDLGWTMIMKDREHTGAFPRKHIHKNPKTAQLNWHLFSPFCICICQLYFMTNIKDEYDEKHSREIC